jgi:hypothetical protein
VEDANREYLALAFVTMVALVPALITPYVDNMRQNVNLNDLNFILTLLGPNSHFSKLNKIFYLSVFFSLNFIFMQIDLKICFDLSFRTVIKIG